MSKRILTLMVSLIIMAAFASNSSAMVQIPDNGQGPEYYDGIYSLVVAQKCFDENGKNVKMPAQKRYMTLTYQPALENTYMAVIYKTLNDARSGISPCGETDIDFLGISPVQDVTFLFQSAGGDASVMVMEGTKGSFVETCQIKLWGSVRTDAYRGQVQRKTLFIGKSVGFCTPDDVPYFMCDGNVKAKWVEELP
jgi:hypothetical protein